MNFEAVGPDRLVLVARDPWIAAPWVIGARVCHSIFFRSQTFPGPAKTGQRRVSLDHLVGGHKEARYRSPIKRSVCLALVVGFFSAIMYAIAQHKSSGERNRIAGTWLMYEPKGGEKSKRIIWIGCLSATSKIHCPPVTGGTPSTNSVRSMGMQSPAELAAWLGGAIMLGRGTTPTTYLPRAVLILTR
jgi:hypothetical protein